MLLAASLAPASAQEVGPEANLPAAPHHGSGSAFRSRADLVVLPVTVTDVRQKFLTGLGMEDFQVYEDGILQELELFAADPVPLDLAVLLDTSASMTGNKIAMAQEAAGGFVRTLRPGDRAAVIEFNDAAYVRQPLIGDLARVESAIRTTTARGTTALHTALYIALKELARANPKTGEVRRQAIVLLSDGEDTRSLVTADDVLELVRQSGIVIYTISLRSTSADSQGRTSQNLTANTRSWFTSQSDYLMRKLAEETGGRAFFPRELRELVPVYGVIAEELASQYTLGYSSKNPRQDGAFRRLMVRLLSPLGARPRTRLGYLAPRVLRQSDELR